MSLVCTIRHKTIGEATDEYNNPLEMVTEFTAACELQQLANDERTVDANLQRSDWMLFVAPTCTNSGGTIVETEIDGGDQVVVGGVTYEVDGPPWPARNPRTQTLTHIQVNLRRTV